MNQGHCGPSRHSDNVTDIFDLLLDCPVKLIHGYHLANIMVYSIWNAFVWGPKPIRSQYRLPIKPDHVLDGLPYQIWLLEVKLNEHRPGYHTKLGYYVELNLHISEVPTTLMELIQWWTLTVRRWVKERDIPWCQISSLCQMVSSYIRRDNPLGWDVSLTPTNFSIP